MENRALLRPLQRRPILPAPTGTTRRMIPLLRSSLVQNRVLAPTMGVVLILRKAVLQVLVPPTLLALRVQTLRTAFFSDTSL